MCNCASTSADVVEEMPWVTFVAFQLHRHPNALPEDLLAFLVGMVNREDIIEKILRREFLATSVLVRLPLPLGGYIGRILIRSESAAVTSVVDALLKLKQATADQDHRSAVRDLLDQNVLPLPTGDAQSLVLIARTSEQYTYPL
jgi:hypothetical protein